MPNPAPKWTSDTPSRKTNDFALSFAPGTQVIVPDTNTVVQLDQANPSFTMQAWVKLNGNPATRQVFYYNNGPGGALSFSIFTNRTVFVTTLGVKDQSSNAKIPDDGNWHHIAVVHENAKEFRFFVDGVLADTQAYTGSVIFTRTNQVFYIGSEPTYGLQYTGLLDRLKVTRGILPPSQLDYPAGGTPPELVEVGALEGGVGVLFDRPISAGSATNVANYTVDGATVTSATLVSPNYVILGVSAVPTNAFAVTVTGVKTPVGDAMPEAATLTAPATVGGTITTGLTAYWSFDGHLADAINGFDGAARGKVPVAFTDAPLAGFGKSLKLTGTNYVEIPGSSNTLQFANGSLSIAGWFKVDAFDKSWQALIAKGENSNYRLARRSDGVIAGDTSIAYAGGIGEGPGDTPPVNDGKWHHFVAITDATAAKFGTALYIDGVIHGVNTNKPALQAGTANLLIGENPEALNRQWVGELDDIGLWNRVLAPQEIATLYNGGQGTPVSALPGIVAPVPNLRPYTIGLNFASEEPNGANLGVLAPLDVAGALPQAHWNNLTGQNGTNVNNLVADTDYETSTNTDVTVSWVSNNTWASTGSRGETNNFLTGADKALTIGYLDSGSATTSTVTITNIPAQLTGNGYDVYVYAIGGVGGRGGAYRVLDAATKQVLKDYVRVVGNTNSTAYVEALINPSSTNYAAGNFFVFKDLTAAAITVEATTENGYGFSATPRAPINAIQLVEVTAVEGPAISIERTATGLSITFEGKLESADSVSGPWTEVSDKSPLAVTPDAAAKFYRAKR
ncbi:MAG: LamG domain-containing protein [Verrucomicrobiota bacterium]